MELHAEVAGSSRGEDKGREQRVYVGALLSNTGFSTLEGPLGDDVDAVLEDGSQKLGGRQHQVKNATPTMAKNRKDIKTLSELDMPEWMYHST